MRNQFHGAGTRAEADGVSRDDGRRREARRARSPRQASADEGETNVLFNNRAAISSYRPHFATDRQRQIDASLEHGQAIQLMMRLSQDMRILSRRRYAAFSKITDSLARQAQGCPRSSGRGKPERAIGSEAL